MTAIRAPLAALLLTACAAARAQPPRSSDHEPTALSSGREHAGGPPVRLLRHHPAVAHYERRQEVSLKTGGGGHAFRFEARSTFEVRPRPGHTFAVVSRFDPIVLREDGRLLEPLPPPLRGLERIRLHHVVNVRDQVVDGPTASGQGSRRPAVQKLGELFRHLRLVLPGRPVQVGARWTAPPVRWDMRPFARVVLEAERAYELEGIQDGRARIRWEGEVTVPPFQAMGVRLEGRGTLVGTSMLSLEDGVTGHTNLDLDLSMRPAGAGPSLTTLLSFRVKYVEIVSRLP